MGFGDSRAMQHAPEPAHSRASPLREGLSNPGGQRIWIQGGHADAHHSNRAGRPARGWQGLPVWAVATAVAGPGRGPAQCPAASIPLPIHQQGLVVGGALCCCIFVFNGSAIGGAIGRVAFCMQWRIIIHNQDHAGYT